MSVTMSTVRTMNRCWLVAGALVAAAPSVSCGATFPRQTFAEDGRGNDPWLEGARCDSGSSDDAAVRVEQVEAGTGKVVGVGETVRVHYVASLPNGSVVRDTHNDGAPVELIIGSTKIICGFEKALIGMRAGEQRRAYVPWHLGFGEAGKPPEIEPRTDLVFVIDLFLPASAAVQNGSPPENPAMRQRPR
jgi:hypothetical protein